MCVCSWVREETLEIHYFQGAGCSQVETLLHFCVHLYIMAFYSIIFFDKWKACSINIPTYLGLYDEEILGKRFSENRKRKLPLSLITRWSFFQSTCGSGSAKTKHLIYLQNLNYNFLVSCVSGIAGNQHLIVATKLNAKNMVNLKIYLVVLSFDGVLV